MGKYLINGFLLILPVLIWNMLFTRSLPEVFSKEKFDRNVPSSLIFTENILRIIVMTFPLFMPIHLYTQIQWAGLALYIAGILVYFASWLVQIFFPRSAWSRSKAGFLAPAYTPVLWLTGTGLITGSFLGFESAWISAGYIALSITFIAVHLRHAAIAYKNTKR